MAINRKYLQWAWLILLLLTPIVLWLLPSDFFDESRFVICPSRFLFDIECLGCGMTRAVMHMHHFEFEDAIFYNTGSVVIYPALGIIWLIWVIKSGRRLGLINLFQKKKPAE